MVQENLNHKKDYLRSDIDPSIKVSVHIITYNHECFIRQAIEGVLMQKVNFTLELVIGDDCSTDNTREIIKEYHVQYPDIIKPMLHLHNLGPKGLEGKNNFLATYFACKGKYVAFCDGDDYWTDPHKLQKQVDFLEANNEYSICFHAVKIENLISKFTHESRRDLKAELTINDYAHYNFINTVSVVFRNVDPTHLSNWFEKCLIGDYPLFLYVAQFGKIWFMNEIMGVYRFHSNGFWNGRDINLNLLKLIETLEIVIEIIPQIKDELIQQQYETFKKIANSNPALLDHLPKSLVHLIYRFEELKQVNAELKQEIIELNKKYKLLYNSKPVRLAKAIKKVVRK